MASSERSFTSFIKPIFGSGDSPEQDDEPPHPSLSELEIKIKNLQNQTVSAIKTPRTKIAAVNHDAKIETVIDIINESGFSKIPVIKDNKDQILGVVYAKDILKKFRDNIGASVTEIMHPAFFASYSLTISQLIDFFAKNGTTVAFVIDEFGGVDGMVTLNDVNWEIFGKIKDKFDIDDEPKLIFENNKIIVDGSYDMEDFMRLYRISSMNPEGHETLGGYICHSLGKIPEPGSKIELDDFIFKILKADNKKIAKILIEKAPQSSSE